jgi:hypothetical protein
VLLVGAVSINMVLVRANYNSVFLVRTVSI